MCQRRVVKHRIMEITLCASTLFLMHLLPVVGWIPPATNRRANGSFQLGESFSSSNPPGSPSVAATTETTTQHAALPNSPLSLTIAELSPLLGGKGRAQACWDCLKLGIDPLWYHSDVLQEEHEGGGRLNISPRGSTRSDTQSLMPSRRQTNGLGERALDTYLKVFGGNIESTIADLVHINVSRDGTAKLLLELKQDELQVETVIIPWTDRKSSTLCISSQVGCRQACTFCATGKMGKLRSLSADEILAQVYWAQRACRLLDTYPINNVVFMGMGEPADNVENVVRACRILTDRQLFQLGGRRVTVSTVGPAPQSFLELAQAPVVLAWSVHASQNHVRKSLVPTTRYTMEQLRDEGLVPALQQRPKRLRTTMLEVTLLQEINDGEQDALDLVRFCQPLLQQVEGIKLTVNLIPWNDIFQSKGNGVTTSQATKRRFRQPTMEQVLKFQQVLLQHDILCYIRTTRGDDESAACGQLATKSKQRVKNNHNKPRVQPPSCHSNTRN